ELVALLSRGGLLELPGLLQGGLGFLQPRTRLVQLLLPLLQVLPGRLALGLGLGELLLQRLDAGHEGRRFGGAGRRRRCGRRRRGLGDGEGVLAVPAEYAAVEVLGADLQLVAAMRAAHLSIGPHGAYLLWRAALGLRCEGKSATVPSS